MNIIRHSIFTLILVAFSALSCSKVENPAFTPGEVFTANYSVAFDHQTKALGEGQSINYVWCAAYKITEVNGETSYTLSAEPILAEFVSGIARCDVDMVRDQSYKVVFIAQHFEGQNPTYPVDKATAIVSMPATAVANSDYYDLFGYVDTVNEFKGFNDKSITLTRKVAQMNFSTTPEDLAAAATAGKTPTHSAVTIGGVPAQMSMLDGNLSDNTINVAFEKAPLTGETNQLASVFFLCEEGVMDVTATLYIYKDADLVKEYGPISALPSQMNYRTNVKVEYKF